MNLDRNSGANRNLLLTCLGLTWRSCPHAKDGSCKNSYAPYPGQEMTRTERYKCLLILGAPGSPKLHRWDNWQQLFPTLAELLQAVQEKPNVLSRQIDLQTRKHVAFGKIPWTLEDSKKWTAESPATKGKSTNWFFEHTIGYFPSLKTAQEKYSSWPRAYFEVWSEYMHGTAPPFEHGFFLCMQQEFVDDQKWSTLASLVCEILQTKLAATAELPFATYSKTGSFGDNLDYFTHEKLGQIRSAPDLKTIVPPVGWKPLAEQWPGHGA